MMEQSPSLIWFAILPLNARGHLGLLKQALKEKLNISTQWIQCEVLRSWMTLG